MNVEIWMLLIEKALAKLMGGYLMLRNIQEQLVNMLTGCPYFNLTINEFISQSKLFNQ